MRNFDYYIINKIQTEGKYFLVILKQTDLLTEYLENEDWYECSSGWFIDIEPDEFPHIDENDKVIYLPNTDYSEDGRKISIEIPKSCIYGVSYTLKKFQYHIDEMLENYTCGEKPREDSSEMPPIGVMPEKLFELGRIKELSRAIYEYCYDDRIDVVEKWVYELNSRVTMYNSKYNKLYYTSSYLQNNKQDDVEGMGDY